MSTIDLKTLIERGTIQLNHDDWDRETETKPCPKCNYVMRFWYITAYTRDGDFFDAFTSDKCIRCDYEEFDFAGQEGELSAVKKQTQN